MNNNAQAHDDLKEQIDALEFDNLHYGEVLKKARQHYGLSIPDVEGLLHIRGSYLLALEENNIDVLPGRVYAIGFVRSYAQFLGLDGDKMIHLFKRQAGNKVQKPNFQVPVAASESKMPNLYIFGFALLALSILFFIFNTEEKETITISERSTVIPSVNEVLSSPLPIFMEDDLNRMVLTSLLQNISPAPNGYFNSPGLNADTVLALRLNNIQTASGNTAALALKAEDKKRQDQINVLAESQFSTTKPKETIVTAPAENVNSTSDIEIVQKESVILRATESSWVEILTPQGKKLVSKVLKPGDEYTIPNEEGYMLHTGNLGGVEVYIGDQMLPKLGKTGDVGKNISLYITEEQKNNLKQSMINSDAIIIEDKELDVPIVSKTRDNDSTQKARSRFTTYTDERTAGSRSSRERSSKSQRSRDLYEGFPYSGNPYGKRN